MFPELTLVRGEAVYERAPGGAAGRADDDELFGKADGENVRR